MSDVTIVLRGAAAEKLRKLMTEQRYTQPEDAVEDALDALQADADPALDAWLRETIAQRAEAFSADPSRALTPDQVRALLLGKS